MTQCVECLSTGAGSCSFCSLDSLCHNSSSWGPTSPGDSHSFVRRHRIRHRLLLVRVRDAEGKLLESAHGASAARKEHLHATRSYLRNCLLGLLPRLGLESLLTPCQRLHRAPTPGVTSCAGRA